MCGESWRLLSHDSRNSDLEPKVSNQEASWLKQKEAGVNKRHVCAAPGLSQQALTAFQDFSIKNSLSPCLPSSSLRVVFPGCRYVSSFFARLHVITLKFWLGEILDWWSVRISMCRGCHVSIIGAHHTQYHRQPCLGALYHDKSLKIRKAWCVNSL